MKRSTQKLLSMLLSLVMVLSLLPTAAFAVEAEEIAAPVEETAPVEEPAPVEEETPAEETSPEGDALTEEKEEALEPIEAESGDSTQDSLDMDNAEPLTLDVPATAISGTRTATRSPARPVLP